MIKILKEYSFTFEVSNDALLIIFPNCNFSVDYFRNIFFMFLMKFTYPKLDI